MLCANFSSPPESLSIIASNIHTYYYSPEVSSIRRVVSRSVPNILEEACTGVAGTVHVDIRLCSRTPVQQTTLERSVAAAAAAAAVYPSLLPFGSMQIVES